ncbi:MAG TPA: GAF domain-containing protein [Anaerolineales bacterium]|nr:GAF domain-containing protein [Anaerolineales bacterium]
MTAHGPARERTRSSLELLYRIGRELAAQLDLRQLLQHILQLTLETVGAPSGSILVLNNQGEVLEGALAYEGKVHDHTAEQLTDTFERGLAGWVVEHREPALVRRTADDPRWLRRPEHEAEGESRSVISVPLMTRTRVVGVLTLVHPEAGHFNEDDLELLSAIADQAGIAVENARLFSAEQERRKFASTLQEVARSISSTLDPALVFPTVLEQLERVVDFDSASILLRDGDVLRLVAARGFANNRAIIGLTLPVNPDMLTGRVLTTRQTLVIGNVQEERGWVRSDEVPESALIRGWIGAPLIVRDRAVGVLNVDSRRVGTYGATQAELVAAFADQAAAAVTNSQMFAETQAARQRYASLFEDSIDPILITDLQGKVSDANRRAQEFLGTSHDDLVGESVLKLHQPDPDQHPPELGSLQEGETDDYTGRAMHRDGRQLPIEIHVKRIDIGPQGTLQWILRDISERLALDELRLDLTSMIFHDLRSPLGNIISSLEMLQATLPQDDEAMQSILSIALRSSRRLSRLVESLLDLGQLESGQAVLHKTPAAISGLIAEAVEEVHPVAEARGHLLQFGLGKAELPAVEMDVDMIRRVLINLLENAIKYTRSGGQIGVAAHARAGDLVVSVTDNGPGIPASEQKNIFEKFARANQEGNAKGLGLGLAFCRLAVEAHGGRIWVESDPGKGSTFSFSLPLSSEA